MVKRFVEVQEMDEFLRTFPPLAALVPNNNFPSRGLRAGWGKGQVLAPFDWPSGVCASGTAKNGLAAA